MEFSKREEIKFKTLHPDLLRVVRRAAELMPTPVFMNAHIDAFMVIQTDRSAAEQARNVKRGASGTLYSRHVIANNRNGKACAIDMAPVQSNGIIPWKRWELFAALNAVMQRAAKELKVPIEWGGNWKSPKDGDHWQLPWKQYP